MQRHLENSSTARIDYHDHNPLIIRTMKKKKIRDVGKCKTGYSYCFLPFLNEWKCTYHGNYLNLNSHADHH
jgi:hypothetical protein